MGVPFLDLQIIQNIETIQLKDFIFQLLLKISRYKILIKIFFGKISDSFTTICIFTRTTENGCPSRNFQVYTLRFQTKKKHNLPPNSQNKSTDSSTGDQLLELVSQHRDLMIRSCCQAAAYATLTCSTKELVSV